MSVYVTDTHPLLWYAGRETKHLPAKVRQVFDAAADRRAVIWVPAAVLWEVSMLMRVGKIQFRETFPVWTRNLLYSPCFSLAEINAETIIETHAYPHTDPFDALIVSVARILNAPLITADHAITESKAVDIFW